MKTKILLMGIIFLFIQNVKSQNNNQNIVKEDKCRKEDFSSLTKTSQLITYDFTTGKFDERNIRVKRNEPIAIKIKNINPFFYRINVKSDDKTISYQNTDSEELNKVVQEIQEMNYYKIQEQYSFEQGTLWINNTNNIGDNQNDEEFKKIKDEILTNEKLIIDEKGLLQKIDNNLEDKTLLGNLQQQLSDNKKSQKIKEYEIAKLLEKTKNKETIRLVLYEEINRINKQYSDFENTARDIVKLNQNYNNYVDKVITSELNYDMYQNIVNNQNKKNVNNFNNEIETTFFLNKKNLDSAYKTFQNYRYNYQDIIGALRNFIVFVNYKLMNLDDHDINKVNLINEVERIQKSVKNIDEVIQRINLSKKLNQVEILDRLLRKPCTFEYVSAPIQGEEDYLEFDVKIRSKRNMEDTFHVDNDKSFVYKKFIDGGVRFDVSVGTVFDFFTTDKKYTLSTENVVQRLDNNKYNPTIAAIFHASFRTHNTVAYGISLGTSFTTNFSFNSLFPGFSMLIGKTNKVILTIGPSFRSVDELKTNYLEGQKLTAGIADEDLLTKNFRVGVFFGISYNLTQKQQSSMKLAQ